MATAEHDALAALGALEDDTRRDMYAFIRRTRRLATERALSLAAASLKELGFEPERTAPDQVLLRDGEGCCGRLWSSTRPPGTPHPPGRLDHDEGE